MHNPFSILFSILKHYMTKGSWRNIQYQYITREPLAIDTRYLDPSCFVVHIQYASTTYIMILKTITTIYSTIKCIWRIGYS